MHCEIIAGLLRMRLCHSIAMYEAVTGLLCMRLSQHCYVKVKSVSGSLTVLLLKISAEMSRVPFVINVPLLIHDSLKVR